VFYIGYGDENMAITHKMDFVIEDLPEDKELEFTERFVALVEEFGCYCGGGLTRYTEDDEDENVKA
jgi:hypothetical protein